MPKTKIWSKLYVVLFFLLIVYILFLLGRTVWQNYGINKEIANSQKDISRLQEENKNLQDSIQYYQSTTYKEQQARLKLNYQKPGEKVYIIPNKNNSQEENQTENTNNNTSDSRPNYLRWWQFLF